MITIRKEIQSEAVFMLMEEMVPKDSIFRKIDKYIDFTFIYEEVKDLYCENNGRPSIDPVVLFKLVFIQAIDGIKSMRKTCKKIQVDAEYRWFLGIPFGKETPHFSTFSKNYERRFKGTKIFENIFIKILNMAERYGMLNEEFFMDSTHRKANANKNKYVDKIVKEVKKRRKFLEEEINEERKRTGKKEFEYKDEIKEKHIKVSTTDKESGYYHRDNKEKGFMYLEHRTVNGKCNIITDAHVTKGNVHDSAVCIERLEYQRKELGLNIKKVGLDSGYDTIDIKKYFQDEGIYGVIQYRSYGQGETKVRKYEFKYHQEEDCYECPRTGVILPYRNINKYGYKEYYDINQCKNCPFIKECCGKNKYRKIRRLISEEINEEARKRRLSEEGKGLLKERRTTVERSFGDSKQNHGYRYTLYKGVEKNQDYTHLICAAQNMKNIALKQEKVNGKPLTKETIYSNIIKKMKNLTKLIKIQKLLSKENLTFFQMWGLSTI